MRNLFLVVFLLPSLCVAEVDSASSTSANSSVANFQDCVKASGLVSQAVKLGDGSVAESSLYAEATRLCPPMAEAHYNYGVVLYKQQKYAEAESALTQAIERKEDSAFLVARGTLRTSQNKLEEARQDFERAITLSPDNPKAIQGMALVFDKLGRHEEALELLKKALQKGDNSALWFNLAVIYDRSNQSIEALSAYENAIKVDPKNVDALFFSALLLQRIGRLSEAETSLKRASDLAPGRQDLSRALGQLYEQLEDQEKAMIAFRRAIVADPKDAKALLRLSVLELEQDKASQAQEHALQALALEPQNAFAKVILGTAQMKLGEVEKAEVTLNEAIADDSSLPEAHQALGTLLKRLARSDEAKEHFDRAQRLFKARTPLQSSSSETP